MSRKISCVLPFRQNVTVGPTKALHIIWHQRPCSCGSGTVNWYDDCIVAHQKHMYNCTCIMNVESTKNKLWIPRRTLSPWRGFSIKPGRSALNTNPVDLANVFDVNVTKTTNETQPNSRYGKTASSQENDAFDSCPIHAFVINHVGWLYHGLLLSNYWDVMLIESRRF